MLEARSQIENAMRDCSPDPRPTYLLYCAYANVQIYTIVTGHETVGSETGGRRVNRKMKEEVEDRLEKKYLRITFLCDFFHRDNIERVENLRPGFLFRAYAALEDAVRSRLKSIIAK